MEAINFTFPFEIATLIVAIISYLAASPLITAKLPRNAQFIIWALLSLAFGFIFTWGYALRFILAIAIMIASRMRLHTTGALKEVQLIVVTIVVAMLFVGLR